MFTYYFPLPLPVGTVIVTVVLGWVFAYCAETICPVLALIGICFVGAGAAALLGGLDAISMLLCDVFQPLKV
jgi:hypothetical protein